MADRKLVKIAQFLMVLALMIWSRIWAPVMMALTRPMSGKATVAGGCVAAELIPPIGRSCSAYVPIGAWPPFLQSMGGMANWDTSNT